MSRGVFVCLAALSLPFVSAMKPVKTSSPQEAMQLRRITGYWKEGDYQAAKKQILDLLARFPESGAKEQLYAMLGDLYFFENAYKEALDAYAHVEDAELKHKTRLNTLRSLFALSRFEEVIQESALSLQLGHEVGLDAQYLLAESLWRQGMQAKEESEKRSYLERAKSAYEALSTTKFKDAALFPLALICRDLKAFAQAASLFAELIEKHPEKKEELLFQMASLKIHDDKEEAAKIFGSIYPLQGKRAAASAFNHLLLLFQMGKYEEFVSVEAEARKHIAPEKASLVRLHLGKSLFALKNYAKAAPILHSYAKENSGKKNPELKGALLSLIQCAKEMKERAVLTSSIQLLGENFPQDLDYAKALIVLAQADEEAGELSLAEKGLSKVLAEFPNYAEKETLVYEKARLLHKAKKWQESRVAFTDFLQAFPKSTQLAAAWHQLIHASLMEREGISAKELPAKNELVVSLLQQALAQKEIWQEKEQENYSLLLAKTLFSLEKWEESSVALQAFVQNFPFSSSAETELMLALSLHHAGKEGEEFFEHAEKALLLNPDLESQGRLHLMLYNGYLKASQQKPHEKGLLEKAADHLYECAVQGKVEIKRDNLLWLANYYYTRAKEENGARFAARAADLFARLVTNLKAITCDTLDLEAEALKYADLLTFLGKNGEALALLHQLKEVYAEKSDLSWKFQRRALLELGRAYTRMGDSDSALKTYDELITSSVYASSAAADAAVLERARLEYGLLKNEEKSDENPRLTSILAALKDLQIKKKLHTEPIHLEAALEYAEIKSRLAPEEKRAERILALLKSLKEEFLSEEDPQAQEYQACRLRLSEKDHLFQTYMKFIDALLFEAESRLSENPEEAEVLKTKASSLIGELKESAATLTPFLREKLQANKPL